MGLREPLFTFLGATAMASGLYWTADAVPLIAENLHGIIAVIFLYAPALASRLSRQPFDYREAGLQLSPIGLGLKVTGCAIGITWPVFVAAFLGFYTLACGADLPAWDALIRRLAPLCPGWSGLSGATWRLPDDFLLLAVSQVVVVALPEEFFFRGYLWTRLGKRRPPLLATSALFAAGHFLVDFNPQRLIVFFPGLAFGWMRGRTGSIAAGTVFHAGCNLLSEVLHASFFR
jgi:membrane protease YdiL (CAAX protease family)